VAGLEQDAHLSGAGPGGTPHGGPCLDLQQCGGQGGPLEAFQRWWAGRWVARDVLSVGTLGDRREFGAAD